ncbi:hypothetical protein ACLOJK_005470 [Asimina triloba]
MFFYKSKRAFSSYEEKFGIFSFRLHITHLGLAKEGRLRGGRGAERGGGRRRGSGGDERKDEARAVDRKLLESDAVRAAISLLSLSHTHTKVSRVLEDGDFKLTALDDGESGTLADCDE